MLLSGLCRTSQQTILNVLGSLYLSVIFLGILNAIFVQPVISAERSVMYRERGAGMWGSPPYSLSCCAKVVCILTCGACTPLFIQ